MKLAWILPALVGLGGAPLHGADTPADARIREISRGEKVDVKRHLVPGKYTIVAFFHDDWSSDGLDLSAKIEAQVRGRDDMVLRRIKVPEWNAPVARQYGITSLPHYKFWNSGGRLVKEYSPKDANRAPTAATAKAFETRKRTPTAAKILTISTGREVAIKEHLVRGQHTLIEFYADW